MTENYDLTMERTYPAPPRAVYDAFLPPRPAARGLVAGGLPSARARGVHRGPGAVRDRAAAPARILHDRALRRSGGLLDWGGTDLRTRRYRHAPDPDPAWLPRRRDPRRLLRRLERGLGRAHPR